jgi:SpoVK/Ycf46/Vps4 family AAA+-type ATPase
MVYLVRYALNRLEPEDEKKRKTTMNATIKRLERIREEQEVFDEDDRGEPHRTRKEDLTLNQYEQVIASEVIAPEDIHVGFKDIGGLGEVIEELKESVIYPLTMPHIYSYSSSLLSAPSGVLLYGPPGCGKTMLAKALANESGATFINLHISTLLEKWFGDSNKLVNAVFTLARKLQPTIVFIDEIDAVLGQRRSGEHEASNMVKAEFMTHWDGLASANTEGEQQRILVLGATNRIQDIDEAILRRMPKKFPVSLPNASQRLRILGIVLKDTKVDKENFDLEYIVQATSGMSGSDIKEACRDAAMAPVREFIRQKQATGGLAGSVKPNDIRGMRSSDFFGTAGGYKPAVRRASQSLFTDGEVEEVHSTEAEEISD